MNNITPPINAAAVATEAEKKQLLKTGSSYKRQVIIVFIGLIIFWLLYFGLVALSLWVIWLLWDLPLIAKSIYGILFKVGSLAMGVMFFVFLLKFLFKLGGGQDKSLIEIKEKEQPRLFAFLRQLSKEVGAPFPKKVYVNHEINACVFYHNPLLSLFFPVRKNLLIGLGLVNSLNLTELKAVLAHEFGHFSQGSMRLGSYVYMANRIIYDMVYSRDGWDTWLERWRSSDFRLAIFAWILTPFIWAVRMLMQGLYRGLNILQSSLSRQMEFHADRVAVSATGSAAIVHSLYRLDTASEAFDFATSQLKSAFDHKIYTDNIFYHQQEALHFLINRYADFKKKTLDEVKNPAKEKEVYLFDKDNEKVSNMYASHPSNYLREVNAKSIFIPAAEDNRSAWLLFDNTEALAQAVTKSLYLHYMQVPANTKFTPATEVQNFINEEIRELDFDDRYHGYYGNRYLSVVLPENRHRVVRDLNLNNPTDLDKTLQDLYGEQYKAKLQSIYDNEQYLGELGMLIQSKQKTVSYKGKNYSKQELKEEIDKLQKLEEEQGDWFEERDVLVYAVYMSILQRLDWDSSALIRRYDFQWEFQKVYHKLDQSYAGFIHWLRLVIERNNLNNEEVVYYATNLSNAAGEARVAISLASQLKLPELNNMETVTDLGKFLAPNGIPVLYSNEIDGASVQKFDITMQDILKRGRRILRKNLGKIIAEQEAAEKAYKERFWKES